MYYSGKQQTGQNNELKCKKGVDFPICRIAAHQKRSCQKCDAPDTLAEKNELWSGKYGVYNHQFILDGNKNAKNFHRTEEEKGNAYESEIGIYGSIQ